MTVISEIIMGCLGGGNGTLMDVVLSGTNNMAADLVPGWLSTLQYQPWMWAMLGSVLVGLSGVLPLLVIPIDQTDNLKQGDSANKLKTLLSFAVGGLLGDVFLHSLPEIWANDAASNGGHPTIRTGLLILSGLIVFVAAEKSFTVIQNLGPTLPPTNNANKTNDVATNNNNNNNNVSNGKKATPADKRQITGYLNLLANSIDNFTHGLSLGGAFLVSLRVGLLTTFAILVHEIPHEVGDFAILLKSGFSRWDAAIGQILTAGGGLLGSFAAIMFSGATNSIEARTSWILPFTAGTFLHIALVTVLPDLNKEEDPRESFKQLVALIVGILVMATVTVVME